jgi:arylsulfatase A-like enzyme
LIENPIMKIFPFFIPALFIVGSVVAAPKPNIVLIMVDDMGYSDIEPYGGEIETPNLAKLAKNGVCFTQFYNSARCCPTRASLMTGLHPHQTGIGHMTVEEGQAEGRPPAYQGNLNDSCVTLAQVAKSAGYSTFMTGKWHLSGSNPADWPLQRGFDRYYGCLAGATHRSPLPTAGFTPQMPSRTMPSGSSAITNREKTKTTRFFSISPSPHRTGRTTHTMKS